MVITDGTVLEDGTHQQLLALDGAYAHLHHLQFDNWRQSPQRAGAA